MHVIATQPTRPRRGPTATPRRPRRTGGAVLAIALAGGTLWGGGTAGAAERTRGGTTGDSSRRPPPATPAATPPLAPVPAAADPAPTAPETTSEETSRLAPPIVDVAPGPRRVRWLGRVALGFAYRWGFGQSMPGAALDAEVGAQYPRVSGSVRLHMEVGRLLTGLPHQVVALAPQLWVRVHDRIRIGAGLDTGVLLLSRRTMPGRSMWTVALGGHVGATADLMRVGSGGAIHLELNFGVLGLTQAPGPLSVMTSLAVGYRL